MSKHVFYSYERKCPACGRAVVGDAVNHWHAARCTLNALVPPRVWGWFVWDDASGHDPAGPFATEQSARAIAA